MKISLPVLPAFLAWIVFQVFVICQAEATDAAGSGKHLQPAQADAGGYEWTTDHIQIGVRWQPFSQASVNAYDATRPVIAEDSGYAQFWVSWGAAEPTPRHCDYENNLSGYLRSIEQAVEACLAEGLKTELVLWHCPAWASESGNSGPWRPKPGEYGKFVRRLATYFKGRVHAYQLYHEANLQGMMEDGDIDFLIGEIFKKGARAVRDVYSAKPAMPVVVSTAGGSPCEACPSLAGLSGSGARALDDYYDRLVADSRLMKLVDALNLNVSDHFNGFGMMDGEIIPSVWSNYDLVRDKLDAAGYRGKQVLSSESWIVWDDADNAADVNGDGLKNEQDAYAKTLTIYGQCLQRGLNTMNLPWCDNSSGWSMGLTKRRDSTGRIAEVMPDIVIPAADGGPGVVTSKILLQGREPAFGVKLAARNVFTAEDYINPSDPNHLHYYIWRWYAQLGGGSDEVIRHALAGERNNDIKVWGPGFTGAETYRMASYNRTRETFQVLLYAGGASGKLWADVSIPATIQDGAVYNNRHSRRDFRGEGFADGETYQAVVETKDISMEDGSDLGRRVITTTPAVVENGMLTVRVPVMDRFTRIEFRRAEPAVAD